MKYHVIFLAAALLTSVACNTPTVKPDAKPVPVKSAVPDAIALAKAEAAAALAAVEKKVAAAQSELATLEKRSAVAAAQVASAHSANTNNPPSPASAVVAGETALALGNLPAPDVAASLEAEKRRAATFAGQADEARRLYAAAQGETERMKVEAAQLRAASATAQQDAKAAALKAELAQAALAAAEKANAAALERNRAANQAALDAAEKRADEAEEKAKNERHKLIFRCLLGLGLLCIAGAIAMAVMTQGAMLAKSLMLAGGGALCIGVAQIVSHPWFDRIFGGCVGLAVVGGGFYLWNERRDALKRLAFEKQVGQLEKIDLRSVPTTDDKGRPSNLAVEFDRVMDKPEKAEVKRIVTAVAAKSA